MVSYELMHGDTQLGTLTRYGIDQPWILCHFTAKLAFEEFRPLFEAEDAAARKVVEAVEDAATREAEDAYDKIYEAIEHLNLYLIGSDGTKIESMLLSIVDGEASFRY
ncbi:hypothetical protein [Dictyobacter kobayashii]|uniref:Uncharacterized protein n=1 Tax=Dictyobacter kobayashii TaxID=2014872 RepID=A0A402AK16_9CHLR|nr:hypothetical protein [Dictyobacter kobayashii]GCE19446.1 hypothetical protein KDK_32460 [Dictyobacter kobayashii]